MLQSRVQTGSRSKGARWRRLWLFEAFARFEEAESVEVQLEHLQRRRRIPRQRQGDEREGEAVHTRSHRELEEVGAKHAHRGHRQAIWLVGENVFRKPTH